jgi:hypothetical protein
LTGPLKKNILAAKGVIFLRVAQKEETYTALFYKIMVTIPSKVCGADQIISFVYRIMKFKGFLLNHIQLK